MAVFTPSNLSLLRLIVNKGVNVRIPGWILGS